MLHVRFFSILAALLFLQACHAQTVQTVENAEAPAPDMPHAAGDLTAVADFGFRQVTGVTVNDDGRLFVNFPLWQPRDYKGAVAEVMPDGMVKPFPDDAWNETWTGRKPEQASKQFICVQSVVAHGGALYVLDPASPGMKQVVPGGPKLVKINLANNTVDRVYSIPGEVAPGNSYLNDVRFDPEAPLAYITDSGAGGLVVLNLDSGESRRVLASSAQLQADPNKPLVVRERPLQVDGETPQIHSDGIAISPDGKHLYLHVLTGTHTYSLPTKLLHDGASDEELQKALVDLGEDAASDGMLVDAEGVLYLTTFEGDSVSTRTIEKDAGLAELVKDKRLQWPDTLAMTKPNDHGISHLYITASRIHQMPRFNGDKSMRDGNYQLFKLPVQVRAAGE